MNLYNILKDLNISYTETSHKAVYTVEEAINTIKDIDGIGCKNLFLTDNKGNYFLVVLRDDKMANIKEISKLLKVGHLSFSGELDLKKYLKLSRGSVSPFGIINDMDNKIVILLDKDLIGNKLLFHPNTNTKTLSISYDDLIKFIEYLKHKYIVF